MTTTEAPNDPRTTSGRSDDQSPDIPANLALLLTIRRRRHVHRTAWPTR